MQEKDGREKDRKTTGKEEEENTSG